MIVEFLPFVHEVSSLTYCQEGHLGIAENRFLHMTVPALFPVTPLTVDGSHGFLFFLMFCPNFLGDLFHKASVMASALHFCWDLQQALNAYLNSFVLSFVMSNGGPLLGL